ncbi:MAG: trypsin-like serine protease [Pseudomonadota bacterium]|nr:trypsin-like serine protease [Pseudomonadota bacterium]
MVRWLITCAALPVLLSLGAAAGAQEASPRIIGGEDATEDWPWAALIEIDDDPNDETAGYCSGMALTEQLVVTAAHCFFDEDGRRVTNAGLLTVWVGSGSNPRQNPSAARAVDSFELPPEQQNDADALFTVGRDIALLRLSSPVSPGIFPSLADESHRQTLETLDQSRRDEALTAIGWGVTNPDNPQLSDRLQEVQLDYVRFDTCDEAWSFSLVEGQMLCAAELNPVNQQRQDTCQGDSGGPLFLGEDPAPYVVGLTSFGTPDCASQRPTVYTDVSGQIDFIENAGVTLGEPLVDLNFTTGRDRYYTAPDTSVTISASLTNNSLARTANRPSFSYMDSGLEVTADWNGCSGSSPCEVAAELSPEASRSGNFEVRQSALSASPHRGVLSISSSSDEDDYRIKNNDREIPVVFSEQADLSVTARRVVAEADSANNGQATIEVTVKNLSYLDGAVANQVELNVTPPDNTSITGSSANCQADPCILVSSLGPEQTVTARFTLSTSTPRESTFSATVSAENGDFPADNNSTSVTFNYTGQQATSSSDGGGGGGGGGGALGALLALIALAGLRRRH